MTVDLRKDTAELLEGFAKEDGTPVADLVQLLLEQSIELAGKKYEADAVVREAARLDEVVKRGERLVDTQRRLNENLRKQYVQFASENLALRTALNNGTMPTEALPKGFGN